MGLIAAQHLTKTYATASVQVNAVQDVSLDIKAGSFLCFVGPSGSGKATLLNLIGCLNKPSVGDRTGALRSTIGPMAIFMAGAVFAGLTVVRVSNRLRI